MSVGACLSGGGIWAGYVAAEYEHRLCRRLYGSVNLSLLPTFLMFWIRKGPTSINLKVVSDCDRKCVSISLVGECGRYLRHFGFSGSAAAVRLLPGQYFMLLLLFLCIFGVPGSPSLSLSRRCPPGCAVGSLRVFGGSLNSVSALCSVESKGGQLAVREAALSNLKVSRRRGAEARVAVPTRKQHGLFCCCCCCCCCCICCCCCCVVVVVVFFRL